MISLSLVVIARNEAELMPDFLSQHAALADEVIVVDTGSSDATVELARTGGAQVFHFQWCDDFAAARNAGLERAHGKWVLFLDLDEKISPSDFPAIAEVVAGPGDQAWLMETINYYPDVRHLEWQPVAGRYPVEETAQTGFFAARRVGLFPNRPDIRFQGRIHESVLPSIEKCGLKLETLSAAVHHYGYVISEAVNNERQMRYRRLAELKHQDNPADPGALLELATVYLESQEPDLAIPLLQELVRGPRRLRSVLRGRFLLGRILREQNRPQEAVDLLTAGTLADPQFPFCWLELARAQADLLQWPQVQLTLDRAAEEFGERTALFAKEQLRCFVKMGKVAEAVEVAGDLGRRYPNWEEMGALAAKISALAKRLGS